MITPDLIPHAEFHTGIWLQSCRKPSWYYYKKKQNSNTITNKHFIKSLDEPLRELVKFIHKKGIKTTPSCSGHHINQRNLEKIYQELEEDYCLIRSCGLQMKDIETGQRYFHQDKNYDLPWKKRDFLQKVESYQQNGVLGLRLGNLKKVKKQLLKIKIEGVKIREKDTILFFFTGRNQEVDITNTWQEITKQVKLILK